MVHADTVRTSNTLSTVIPNAYESTVTALGGQRRANAAVDLRLFRFGFGFGTVSPRFDSRPAGWSYRVKSAQATRLNSTHRSGKGLLDDDQPEVLFCASYRKRKQQMR